MAITPDPERAPRPEPSFQFSVWDLMVRISTLCCFAAAVHYAGPVAVILFPAVLIGPAVVAHPDNRREVKLAFILINLGIALYLVLTPW